MLRPLHLVGKLAGLGLLNAVATRQLIHMQNQITNRRFLTDTGASYSIIPHRSSLPATGPKLFGPAGQLIPLLERLPSEASIPGSGFFLEISISRCSFPYFGRGFFEIPQATY
jgi:hypothetical protein